MRSPVGLGEQRRKRRAGRESGGGIVHLRAIDRMASLAACAAIERQRAGAEFTRRRGLQRRITRGLLGQRGVAALVDDVHLRPRRRAPPPPVQRW